jgi:hypothetical protein
MRNPLAKLFAPRLKETNENRRLAISLNERALREHKPTATSYGFYRGMDDILEAQEWEFQNTPQIWPVPPKNLEAK